MKKYIILCVVFISFFSCRTIKKEYLEENYAKKESLEVFGQKLSKKINQRISNIEISASKEQRERFNQKSKNHTERQKSEETKTTTVKGRIAAEAGMSKSVSFGGTTLTANGADVEFITTVNDTRSKESFSALENQIKDIAQFSSETFQATKQQQEIIVQQQKAVEILNKEVISLREENSKLIKKTGLQFWIYPGVILLILVLFALSYLRYQFKKIKKTIKIL